ncbi:hypothetical protein DSM100688_2130 [Bifidobacterium ramosum]|uniref:MFS transporter n=2 Tax=Bifidobacterium ramosum TaxID=1798158 RepID=A0A6L4WXI8_9BIFI|nr:hypothetical protein [Bifidobacterium ramosum]KAB8286760.1 hypothetical protein DSM100688_2130 [Bifidobacterium ramosum]
MRGLAMLSVALRWALVGMTLSMLSNAIFEGSVIPSILLVGLPAWVIAFRRTFGLIIDFASPVAAWIVQCCGSFRSLATAEGVEGALCLAVAVVPSGWPYWKWLLLALSCLLLMTGQIIDVAGEVFEVDAAAGDDDMLVRYSGYVGVISSVAGTLLGQVAGSAIANASITAMLLTSAALSFGCALTRFRTRDLMPSSTLRTAETVDETADANADADDVIDDAGTVAAPSDTSDTSDASEDPSIKASTSPDQTDCCGHVEHDHADRNDDERDHHTHHTSTERSGQSDEQTTRPATSRPRPSSLTTTKLFVASLLLALIPSLWTSYALLGLGATYGGDALTILYACGGIGSIIGSFVYMRGSHRLGMRRIATIGIAATAVSLIIVLIPALPAACVTWLINGFGYGLLAQAVIVSRQLLLHGNDLARFSGRSRFAFAIGSAVGTWGGWLGSAHWRLLAAIALVLCAGFVPLLRAMPHTTTSSHRA